MRLSIKRYGITSIKTLRNGRTIVILACRGGLWPSGGKAPYMAPNDQYSRIVCLAGRFRESFLVRASAYVFLLFFTLLNRVSVVLYFVLVVVPLELDFCLQTRRAAGVSSGSRCVSFCVKVCASFFQCFLRASVYALYILCRIEQNRVWAYFGLIAIATVLRTQ